MRLTDLRVHSLPPPEKGQKTFRCDSLPGFGVRVSQGGAKTFILVMGRDRRFVSIGRYPIISLLDARTEAKRILAERTLGKHRPARLMATDALARFIGEQQQKNRARTVDYSHKLLLNHFPKIWKKPLEEIRTEDITNVTDGLLKKGQPGAANHSFTAVKTFLRWCVKRRYIQHSPIEALDPPSRTQARERVLTDDELRALWKALQSTSEPFASIVKLLLFTGQRRTEIASLKSEWINCPHSSTVEHQHRVGKPKNEGDICSTQVGDSENTNFGSDINVSTNTDCEMGAGNQALGSRTQCTIPKEFHQKQKKPHIPDRCVICGHTKVVHFAIENYKHKFPLPSESIKDYIMRWTLSAGQESG